MIGLRTLVLNANYLPLSILPLHTIFVEDAVTRIFNGKCHVVFEYSREILTPSISMKYPSVIASNSLINARQRVALKREALYYRDHGRCAYCERVLSMCEMTYDHVVPKSKGGIHSWDNVVCACARCNTAKGQALPVGAWKLRFKPYEPSYYDIASKRKTFPIVLHHSSWEPFFKDWQAQILLKDTHG